MECKLGDVKNFKPTLSTKKNIMLLWRLRKVWALCLMDFVVEHASMFILDWVIVSRQADNFRRFLNIDFPEQIVQRFEARL